MPPFLVWAAIALIVAAVGGSLLLNEAKGKQILLLGPQRAGKTTLRKFMQGGTITKEYLRTSLTEFGDAKITDQHMKDYKIRLVDVDGSPESRGEWQKQVNSAGVDAICYVVDASRLRDEEYAKEVQNRAKLLDRWGPNSSTKRVLVLSHIDCLPQAVDPTTIGRSLEVNNLRKHLHPDKVTMGNLQSKTSIQEVVWEMLGVFKK